MERVRDFCCPSCGVVLMSADAVVQDPSGSEICILCAPYDPDREDISLALIDDALLHSLYHPRIGAKQIPQPSRPSNVMIAPAQAKTAIEVNNFAKMILDILYEGARFGSTAQAVRDGGKQILDDINALIRAKLDPSHPRLTPLIISKEDTDKYLGILELIHTRFSQAHNIYVGDAKNPEEAKRQSYAMFWHIGSLIRTGQLAVTISPWVTGEQKPRF